jgi:ketosteroid isomerase-like protein
MSAANVDLIQRIYAIHAKGDFDGVLENCSAEIQWCSGGSSEDFPAFGPRKGRAEVRDFFQTVSQAVEFSEFTPLEFFADRDKVFVLGTYTFRMKNGGRKVTSDWVHIFTVANGVVVSFREFLDTARVAEAYRA